MHQPACHASRYSDVALNNSCCGRSYPKPSSSVAPPPLRAPQFLSYCLFQVQVTMERQFDNRPSRHSQADTWSHDRWSSRQGPAGGFDRWSNGNAYGAYNGELPCLLPAGRHTQSLRLCQADRGFNQNDASTSSHDVSWDVLGAGSCFV